MLKRKAKAIWKGTGLEGTGNMTTTSGVLNSTPYSTKMRFEDEQGNSGTNPEELLAASHAGCFAMALSFQLNGADFTADELDVDAVVSIEKLDGGGWEVSHIELKLKAKIPGISKEKFMELANNAKEGCPISKALSAVTIDLNAELV